MYKNHIRRQTAAASNNRNLKFSIRRSETGFDERARYVEFVCDVWNEGRFGPGHVDPVTINWNDRLQPEPVLFSDLLDSEQYVPCPNYTLSSLGRAAPQLVEAAYRRAEQMELLAAMPNVRNSTAALTPNQGRGSP